jgi:hypothetical protein
MRSGDCAVKLPEGETAQVSVPKLCRRAKSMGHVDLKSMEPYQHHELETLREAINQRN